MNRIVRTIAPLALLGLVACEPGSDDSIVARAGDYEFTVAEAVDLLAPRSQLPNEAGVVRTLAELWIDYTLLADATLTDSTYADIQVQELVDDQLASEMVFALRDSVIRPDTAMTEEELRALFAEQGPGERTRARHILLGWPDQATPAQRDSVRQQLEQIARRIRSGEDFATLARTYSQDRGSGSQGGDLGFFGRGEMVAPFEEAAFSLAPGEMSGVVETPFGLHLIRVEERQVPTFEDERERFRTEMQATRVARAESVYVADMEARAQITIDEGAAELVQQLAAEPWARLSRRAAERRLVEYEGGSVTVGEVQRFLQTRSPQYRSQVSGAPETAVNENLLRRPLAQRELFVQAALDAGFGKDAAYRDSLSIQARQGIGQAARVVGFWAVERPAELTRTEAVDRLVNQALGDILSETREVVPLGPVGYALRRTYRSEVFDSGVEAAVRRIESIRGRVTPYTPPSSRPSTDAAPPPDTSAGGAR
ncbi:MAG: peptidylprolyl isomerase [Gemmatimonadota bacterium]